MCAVALRAQGVVSQPHATWNAQETLFRYRWRSLLKKKKHRKLMKQQKEFYLTNLLRIENLILCNQPLNAADHARKLIED